MAPQQIVTCLVDDAALMIARPSSFREIARSREPSRFFDDLREGPVQQPDGADTESGLDLLEPWVISPGERKPFSLRRVRTFFARVAENSVSEAKESTIRRSETRNMTQQPGTNETASRPEKQLKTTHSKASDLASRGSDVPEQSSRDSDASNQRASAASAVVAPWRRRWASLKVCEARMLPDEAPFAATRTHGPTPLWPLLHQLGARALDALLAPEASRHTPTPPSPIRAATFPERLWEEMGLDTPNFNPKLRPPPSGRIRHHDLDEHGIQRLNEEGLFRMVTALCMTSITQSQGDTAMLFWVGERDFTRLVSLFPELKELGAVERALADGRRCVDIFQHVPSIAAQRPSSQGGLLLHLP
jgi:hypothetical protein